MRAARRAEDCPPYLIFRRHVQLHRQIYFVPHENAFLVSKLGEKVFIFRRQRLTRIQDVQDKLCARQRFAAATDALALNVILRLA